MGKTKSPSEQIEDAIRQVKKYENPADVPQGYWTRLMSLVSYYGVEVPFDADDKPCTYKEGGWGPDGDECRSYICASTSPEWAPGDSTRTKVMRAHAVQELAGRMGAAGFVLNPGSETENGDLDLEFFFDREDALASGDLGPNDRGGRIPLQDDAGVPFLHTASHNPERLKELIGAATAPHDDCSPAKGAQ